MARLGQLLVQADLVTENNLARALGVQGFAGGRLGTLLLERGSVDEDALGNTLAEQHRCEYVPWRILSDIPAVTIAALPGKFAIKHAAIPYERGENYLKLAIRDPGDLRILDELFFVTGRKIFAGVSPEVRVYQALEKYYGERRTPRFVILADKLGRQIRASRGLAAAPPPPPEFFPNVARKPTRAPAPQEIWGEPAEPDMGTYPIIESWKLPDQPTTGGWAGTASPGMQAETPTAPETIVWEELPAIPALWVPESAATRTEQEKVAETQPAPRPASAQAPPMRVPPVVPPVAEPVPPRAEAKPVAEIAPPIPPPPPAEIAPTPPAPAEEVRPPASADKADKLDKREKRIAASEVPQAVSAPEQQPQPPPPPPREVPVSAPQLQAQAQAQAAPAQAAPAAPPVAAKEVAAQARGSERPSPPVVSEPAPPAPPKPPTTQPVPVPTAKAPAAPASPELAAARSVPGPSDFPEVAQSTDRDSIATAALSALGRRFDRGAIFAARPDAVAAWGVTGGDVNMERFRSIEIPWNEPSIFLNVRYSRTFYLGPLPPLPRHASFARAIGGWPQECVVYPVLLRDRPVAFLYAEFSQDRGATPMDLAYLRELAAASSNAFASAIRLRKREL